MSGTIKYIIAVLLSISAIIALQGKTSAQDRTEAPGYPDSVKVTMLNEFTILGRVNNEIVPSQTLTGEELRRLSVFSVSDALRYFSGVQIKDYGGIGGLKTVNVRSMGSQHVGVFYDGIQVTNAQNGTVDLGRFSLDNMEMLSLYNGQKSDIFQSAKDFASASAVYMVSRTPVFESDRRNNFMVKVKTGSFDLINSSVLWESKISGRVSSSVNAEVLNTSGKYRFRYSKKGGYDTTEVRRNGDVFFIRADAALFGAFNKGRWQVKGYMYNSTRGYPGAAVKNDYEITLLNENRQTDRNIFVQGYLGQKLSEHYQYKFRFKFMNDYMHYWTPLETTLIYENSVYRQNEAYATLANLFTINRFWTVNASADFQFNTLDAAGVTDFVKPRRHTLLGALASSVQLNKIGIQGSVLYTGVQDRTSKGATLAKSRNELSPTVIVSYRPWNNAGVTFRAFYKDIFRMPTFNDMYYVSIGNPQLSPEYTVQYNIGAAYSKSFAGGRLTELNASLDAYYNSVRDKIIAVPTTNQFRWTMINLGLVKIKGLDAAVNAKLKFGDVNFDTRLTYTYQKAQDRTDKGELKNDAWGHQIPYEPWHSGSLIVTAIWGSWNLNYSFIYTGERYSLGQNKPANYVQPWYTHDVSISKSFRTNRAQYRIAAEVNNIFNQYYDVVKWYPMPGTNFKINLTVML